MNQIEIHLPTPHCSIQKTIMEAFINKEGPDEIIVPCGTKFGKTLSCDGALAAAMPIFPKTDWRWVAPFYSQAEIGYNNLRNILPRNFVRARKTAMTISIPSIEATSRFVHAQNAEQLEGHQIHGYIIDEAAKIKEEVYYSARTTVTRTRSDGFGKMIIPSTPLGKGWFYRKAMEAKNEMELAALNNRKPRMICLTAPTSANPFISPSVIADAKKRLPDRLFRQFYLAEFLDESATFTNIDRCLFGDCFSMPVNRVSQWLDTAARTKSVVIGADWARGSTEKADNTCFIAIDPFGDRPRVCGIMKLRGLNYTQQIAYLCKFAKNFSETLKVNHDKTGVGIAIDDQLKLTDLVFQGITFTLQSKAEMVTSLITATEQTKLEIPNCQDLKNELNTYEMDVTDNGFMRFAAAAGCHDDMVCALLLAYEATRSYRESDLGFVGLDELEGQSQKAYYDSLIEDEDDGVYFNDWLETVKTVGA